MKPADQGKVLTVVVTATSGSLPPGTATSEGVAVLYAASVSLSLSRQVFFSWQTSTATVKVDSAADAPVSGTVTVKVNGKTVTGTLVDTTPDQMS